MSSKHLIRLIRLILATSLATPFCLAQAPPPYTPTLTFDVISVRESKPDDTQSFMVGGGFAGNTGTLTMSNNSLANMLSMAYGVSRHQLQGLPDWTDGPMYNIQAKADEAADSRLASLPPAQAWAERQHMMQALLADRFNLQTHWETREAPVYNLVVSKGGPKMQPAGSMPPSPDELKGFGTRKLPEIHQRGDGKRGYEYIGHSCHIASLARNIASDMATDVIDRTALTGAFDFDLQYSQARDAQREADPTIWPRITEALEDQLGLKLEHARGPVKMLVVDHISKPSQN